MASALGYFAVGIGLLLIYSAYKDVPAADVLKRNLGGAASAGD